MYICIHVYRGIYLGLVLSSGSELLGMHIPVCKSFIVCKRTRIYIYTHTQLVKKPQKTDLAGSVGNQIRSTHIATG